MHEFREKDREEGGQRRDACHLGLEGLRSSHTRYMKGRESVGEDGAQRECGGYLSYTFSRVIIQDEIPKSPYFKLEQGVA